MERGLYINGKLHYRSSDFGECATNAIDFLHEEWVNHKGDNSSSQIEYLRAVREIMIIKDAKFIISNSTVAKCPDGNIPEYAFIGRSNVGKSSLINALTQRKALAKTSATPGKTMLINHFLINNQWYIVDLPGYGYARRGKEDRETLKQMIHSYVLHRQQLTNLFVLVDIRLKPQKIDLEFIQFLGENGVPFSIVFTKADKLGPVAGLQKVEEYKKVLLADWDELPPIFITSSESGKGRDSLLDYIDRINKEISQQ